MGRLRDCCTAWLALPAAWVALAALLVMGSTLGVAQLCFGLLMLVASPLLRRGFLAVVRHIYPTRFGRAHVWFMLFVRRYYLGGRRHAAPIRVELRASQARSPRWKAPPADEAPRSCVHVVAGLLDNYAYVVVELRPSGPLRCVVVDPGDAGAVLGALTELREQHYASNYDGSPRSEPGGPPPVVLTGLLVTHHHWDHQAGVRDVLRAERETTRDARALLEADATPRNPEILWAAPGTIAVVGGEHEFVDRCSHFAKPGQRFRVGRALDIEVIPSPCHTKGHVMFGLLGEDRRTVEGLFTGDTLFCGGCGAPFEGDARDVAANFRRIWHRCGGKCLLFPGHEYSEQLLLEYFGGSQPTPWNPRQYATLTGALQRARDCRAHDRPSVPVLLGNEVLYNTHFGSLHAAANVVQDAWRVFSRAVNARAASDDALATIRRRTSALKQKAEALSPPEPPERSSLLRFLDANVAGVEDPPAAAEEAPPKPSLADDVAASLAPSSVAASLAGFVTGRASPTAGPSAEDRSALEAPSGAPPPPRTRRLRVARGARARAGRGTGRRLRRAPPAADSSEEKAPSMAPLGRPASLPPAQRTVELACPRAAALALAALAALGSQRPEKKKPPAPGSEAVVRHRVDGGEPARDRPTPDAYAHLLAREAAAPDADASPRDGDAKRVDWRDELRDARPVFEALKALSALADESEVKAAERTIYQVPGGDDGDEAKVVHDHELRRALTTLGPRPLTHAMVDELLAVAELGGCCLDRGFLLRPRQRRHPRDAPVALDCLKLANVLAVEGPAPAPPRRALVPCGLCRRACKCPRRAAPEQINVDV
ncbi:hydroxyacylglutathione hydrolase [Aureococcus anophagefferens]|uniref:Hydroxyacylglutathione hydrolase n=1 Tax=Aureococcus anophagefferens TaxID=44056 RepID=A0ABR1GER0_AURAN